jgi:type IV pilus assembly protein PilO
MSRRSIYILAAVVLVVVVIAYWFLLLAPLRSDIADVDSQIADEQMRLEQNQAQLAALERTRLDARWNEARLIELSKMLPPATELPSLILQIQDLATESGINFMTISPGPLMDAGLYQTIPLNLEFAGTFFDLNDFIYRAEQMVAGPGRLLTVKVANLTLDADEARKPSPRLKVTMTLYAFQQTPATQPTQ